jgi:hypothetical protein
MLRRLALASFVLALAPTHTLAVQTWIVDDDPGGHFTTIQAAINAAGVGDRILVQPGSYGDFTLRKGLTIVGYGTPTGGWAQVVDLPAGHVASVVGFDLNQVRVDDSLGVVILQELSMGAKIEAYDSVDVRARQILVTDWFWAGGTVYSSRFELTESELYGASGPNLCSVPNSCSAGLGLSGLFSYASRLHLVHSNFYAGTATNINCVASPASSAGAGISATLGAEVILVGDGSNVSRGGVGGINCKYSPFDCTYDGDSGAGVTLNGQLWYSGMMLEGGTSYVGTNCNQVQEPGVLILAGTATALAVEDPALTLTGTPAAGNQVQFVVHGPEDADVLLYLGRKPVLVTDPTVRIELLTPMNVNWPLGTIDASGAVTRDYKIRPLNPGYTFYAQAELTYPSGEVRRTNSLPIVVR